MNIKIAIVFLQLLIASNGDIELACGTARPSAQTDVTCICRRIVASDIQWYFNGTLKSDCVLNSGCLPQPPGYTFSINVSETSYEMTISAYDYNDCTQINCTDPTNKTIQRMVVPSAINFDQSNPPPISEPALSHNNGNISVTTGCISGYKEVACKWYTVYNHGNPEEYNNDQIVFNENDESACSNCNKDINAKKTCWFYHKEASGNETRNVKFRVVVTHRPTNLKWEINSANVYTVKGSSTTSVTNFGTNTTDSQRKTTISSLKNNSTPNHSIMTSSATMQHTLITTTVKYKNDFLIDRDTALYIGFSSMMFILIVVIACYLSCLKLIQKEKSSTEFQRERDQNSDIINVVNSTQL